MKDDFDEEAFDKSIESIVDEETADAQLFVNKNLQSDLQDEQKADEQETSEESQNDDKENAGEDDVISEKKVNKKAIIIVACAVAVVIIIGVAAFFIVKAVSAKSKDNYGYYNSLGYEALDNKDYAGALVNFEKALTYDEGKTDDKTNINMMLYMYDCYVETDDMEKAEEILKEIISRDKYNRSAYYYLIEMYAGRKEYKLLHDLYLKAKDSNDNELLLYFNNYLAQVPSVSPAGDTYQADQEITLSAPDGYKIYYTVNGSDPTKSASLYAGSIPISEGKTTLKFYAVNEYGFESDVVVAEYNVVYTGPAKPAIMPGNNDIVQSDKAKVIISGTQAGSTVYYTLDGSQPTTASTVYTEPFELPAGITTVSVLVVDSHGKTVTTSKTYNVKYTSKYSDSEAVEFIWKALIEKELVDEEHTDADENPCELNYYSLKQIDGMNIYMFYYNVNGTMQDYWYGADGDTGDVYTVTGKDGKFVLAPLD